MDKEFFVKLSKFIQSVESQIDIMLPGRAGSQFLSHYKVMDYVISQKLAKNIIIRLLCTSDEDTTRLIQHLVPFIGYTSIKQSLPNSSSNSLLFIRDDQDFFSFSIDIKQQLHQHEYEYSNTIFFLFPYKIKTINGIFYYGNIFRI